MQLVLVEACNDSATQPGIGTSIEPERDPLIDEDDELNDQDEAAYDLDLLSHDPGKRIPISSYDVNEQDSVRRGYIALGPCQPRKHNFPAREIGGIRCFVAAWFMNLIGLSTVWKRMLPFALFAIYSRIKLLLVGIVLLMRDSEIGT
jgi:hypothetical protein